MSEENIPLGEFNEKRYMDAGGGVCPYCFSEDITGEDIDIDGSRARQEVTCNVCDKSWHDFFKLVGASPVLGINYLAEWKYEVVNGDTHLGYTEWTRQKIESVKHDEDN